MNTPSLPPPKDHAHSGGYRLPLDRSSPDGAGYRGNPEHGGGYRCGGVYASNRLAGWLAGGPVLVTRVVVGRRRRVSRPRSPNTTHASYSRARNFRRKT